MLGRRREGTSMSNDRSEVASPDGALYQRWWKVWPFPKCCLPCNPVLHPCRAAVSQKKTRFTRDGFDLDLSYVTDRIIVHGFPATGVEHIYRNPRTEVQRLLDKYHLEHYKVYNFANEPGRTYPAQLFQGRVERYPFADHTCPPLESVVDFCENAKAWLDSDEQNVVSLHCKAGKGRAGIMAACLLVRLGETAEAAVATFNSTRVSDTRGLTVVNQRKWVFLYERLIKEVWGLQNSIGMVPGQDPDLRAPTPKASGLREVSIQLEPATDGKPNHSLLRNPYCSVFQQQPMGKVLVHRSKMTPAEAREGEPELVLAASLPRSAVVQGTYQVIFSAATSVASTQRNIVDLWWSTTFIAQEGGNHTFRLTDMDVSSLKLGSRLQQAGMRVVLCHKHPHAESPPRRLAANDTATETTTEISAGQISPVGPSEVPEVLAEVKEERARALLEGEEESLPLRPDASEIVLGIKTDSGVRADGAGSQKQADSTVDENSRVIPQTSETETATAGESDEFTLRPPPRRFPSRAEGQDPGNIGRSPSLPGPSPAGGVSPAWTFEGRIPSTGSGPGKNAANWRQRRMWSSGQIDEEAVMSPGKAGALHGKGTVSGLREKRRTLSRRSSHDSVGSGSYLSGLNSGPLSAGSTSAPTGTGGSMHDQLGQKQPYETESDSDDQLAVRASAFASSAASGHGADMDGRHGKHRFFAGSEQLAASSSTHSAQWVMEMENAFASERRRWDEHRRCLETELDWALAARARAEARSEEDSARVEVLEKRLSAWRNEHALIEGDVKQAVRLLEMSLSGLMSAENALKRWKSQIPDKAYEDIMACLTRGDTTLARA